MNIYNVNDILNLCSGFHYFVKGKLPWGVHVLETSRTGGLEETCGLADLANECKMEILLGILAVYMTSRV